MKKSSKCKKNVTKKNTQADSILVPIENKIFKFISHQLEKIEKKLRVKIKKELNGKK